MHACKTAWAEKGILVYIGTTILLKEKMVYSLMLICCNKQCICNVL